MHNSVLKFKNFITQVMASIATTLTEPLPVLFHDPAGHFGRNGSNFLGYRLLKTFQSLGTMLLYLDFEVVSEKKPHEVKSGERGGHPMPRKHFSENSERTTRCVVFCTILLKPHIFCSKFIEKIIQFRPEKII
jgi:hypothetical protein